MAEPDEDNAIYWYKPEKRGIIFPEEFRCSKNLLKEYRKGLYDLKINNDFEATIRACSEREETWISEEIIEVYCHLNEMGYGYSFEVWKNDELVGGLYGIAIGKIFFGESMFHKVTNASKIAMVFLMEWVRENHIKMVDCQFITDHLKQFGAREISQETYMEFLERYI